MPTSDRVSPEAVMALLSAGPGFHSGERLAASLGVSRVALWKHIQTLRQAGIAIEARRRVGYRLVPTADPLLPDRILSQYHGALFSHTIVHRDWVDSTNALAKTMAAQGAAAGTLVIAEAQTRGRGRRGRSWLAPAGTSLVFSVVLRPAIAPAEVGRLTMASGVAMAAAVRAVTGLPAMLKWPNDLMIHGRKAGGILTEFSATTKRLEYAVVGIGVNVNFDPAILPDLAPGATMYPEDRGMPLGGTAATSLSRETGHPVDRAALLGRLLTELESWQAMVQPEGSAALRKAWSGLLETLGSEVTVQFGNETASGTAESVDEGGALILRLADGTERRVLNGDVTLRSR